jgi:hypothetical protein
VAMLPCGKYLTALPASFAPRDFPTNMGYQPERRGTRHDDHRKMHQ